MTVCATHSKGLVWPACLFSTSPQKTFDRISSFLPESWNQNKLTNIDPLTPDLE